jgi:hypothetical protein
MRWSLLFAALGVLAAFLLLVLLKIQALLIDPGPELGTAIVVGLGALFLSAALLGRLAGKTVYLSGNNLVVNLFVGAALALSCVIISAVAGSLTGVLMVSSKEPSVVRSNPLSDAGGITLWIVLYGSGPALVLGFLYGLLVKVTLDWKLKRRPEAPINQQAGNVL